MSYSSRPEPVECESLQSSNQSAPCNSSNTRTVHTLFLLAKLSVFVSAEGNTHRRILGSGAMRLKAHITSAKAAATGDVIPKSHNATLVQCVFMLEMWLWGMLM
jgi:hypothetical protein